MELQLWEHGVDVGRLSATLQGQGNHPRPITPRDIDTVAKTHKSLCAKNAEVPGTPCMLPWWVFVDSEALVVLMRHTAPLVDQTTDRGRWFDAFTRTRDELAATNVAVRVKVFIEKRGGQEEAMLRHLWGEVVDDRSDANIILTDRVEHPNKTALEGQMIVSMSMGGKCLLHRLFHPQSEDVWRVLPEEDFPDVCASDQLHTLTGLELPLSYLTDSYRHNEWMNPLEYSQGGATLPVVRAPKRARDEPHHQRRMKYTVPEQTSGWYRPDVMHPIESATFNMPTQEYVFLREKIITMYRRQPDVYLTLKAVKNVMCSHFLTASKLHCFLERWGLINYGVEASSAAPSDNTTNTPSMVPFTTSETATLIDAVRKFGAHWHLVEQDFHGKRSQLECATAFVQLKLVADPVPKKGLGQPLPFADASNPMMALLAFLASMVHPEIASAAAQSALSRVATLGVQSQSIENLDMQTACTNIVRAGQVRAATMRDEVEAQLQVVAAKLLTAQLKKVEAKLQFFEELHALSETDKLEFARMNASVRAFSADKKK